MADLALYVHWPFCAAKCPYCDFNSHVAASIDHDAWRRAYLAEIARVRALTGPRRLTSIFFGGGTPSLMQPATVAAVIDAACTAWNPQDVEITLEANPTSAEAGAFQGFALAGVTRLSLGVQALNDADLAALGRRHSASEALAALGLARRIFARTSFDLIYARQDQSLGAWQAELGRALALGPDHLALYQLTIEPGTPFARRAAAGGLRGLPDDDLGADLYAATQQITEAAGLPAYEVSNHARPGAESRHNLAYWRSADWAGIGPGAHGRLTLDGARVATEAARDPAAWLADPAGAETLSLLPPEERDVERLLMGLRLREGIDLGPCTTEFREATLAAAARLPDQLTVAGERLTLTAAGRPLLDAVLRALI